MVVRKFCHNILHLLTIWYPIGIPPVQRIFFKESKKSLHGQQKFRPWQDSNQEKAMRLTPTRATTPTDIRILTGLIFIYLL